MIRAISTLQPGNGIKIMSYNVLAQCLVRREQFPTSGEFLRWKARSKIFPREIENYAPDILLMQEVDNDHRKFWSDLLEANGFHCIFYHHPTKKHGLAICFKTHKFSVVGEHRVDLDTIELTNVPRQCVTNNAALFLELVSKSSQQKLLIGTSHFYWHPDASYERSRQFLCIFNKIKEIKRQDQIVIFGGDFNSEYFDPPYLLATASAITPISPAADIMHKSIHAQSFDKFGAVEMQPDGTAKSLPLEASKINANPNLLLSSGGGGIVGGTSASSCEDDSAPSAADPAAQSNPSAAAAALEEAFHNHSLKATSMYAEYSKTGREAAPCGEPLYTNWTEVFKGTLDYLLCVHEQGISAPIKVLKLLDIKTKEEIGRGGLPKINGSPSDHICIMAEICFT